MLYTSLRGLVYSFCDCVHPVWHSYSEYRSPRQHILYRHQFQTWGSKEGMKEGEGILLQYPSTLAMQMVHWLCKWMTTWTDLRGWGRGTTVGIQSGNMWQRILNCSSLVYSLIVYAAINPVTRPWSHRYYFLTVAESHWSLVCFATDSCVCLKFPNILH